MAGIAAALFLVRVLVPAFSNETYGFPAYYTAARLVLDGKWSTQIFQGEWFTEQVRAQTNGHITEYFSGHPPVTSLLVLPLAALPLDTARMVWALTNLFFLITALWFIQDSLRANPFFFALLTLTAFLFAPVADNIRIGQSYVWQLWLFSIALWGLQRERVAATAFGLGAAAIFKLSGAPVWLLLLAKKRWRELSASLGVIAVWVLLGAMVLGWDSWYHFFIMFPSRLVFEGWQTVVAYQTTPSFFLHLFVFDAQWNPQPLLHAPPLAAVFTIIVGAATLFITLRTSQHAPMDLGFAAAITLSVILFPQAEEYHYSLLLLPFAVAGAHLLQMQSDTLLGILFFSALLLIALPIPYKQLGWDDGMRALLTYPRLYGGWLLWLVLLRQMQTTPQEILSARVVTTP